LSDARCRLAEIDGYRIEMLAFMDDFDVIVGRLCRTGQTASPRAGGDRRLLPSHGAQPDRLAGGRSVVRHIQWRVAHRGADCFAAVAGRDRAGRGRASESVFGGWQPPRRSAHSDPRSAESQFCGCR
jgi:amidase